VGKFNRYIREVILKFSSKEKAIEYAEKNSINYKLVEPKKKKNLS